MRVQHNIMAMGAYRNYTNNVSAMKKNLERLSSGYKINRAGDDAAGLAISEKMRAQITGLETAQKNAKDGISLVQTAEGALTEVHDMLNRMVELATMSANGTYDNATDRLQLQKEMDQLKDEIDRIADSANFNGIQLLDGSMDTSLKFTNESDLYTDELLSVVSDGQLGNATAAGEFELDLENFAITAAGTGTVTITIFGQEITIGTATATGQKFTAADIVKAIASKWAGVAGTGTSSEFYDAYGVTITASANGDKIIFKMDKAPSKAWNEKASVTFGNVAHAYATKNGTEIDLKGGDFGNQAQGVQLKVIKEPVDSSAERKYAQAQIKITDLAKHLKDGSTLTIGDTTYTFAIGRDSKYKDGDNVIDLTDLDLETVQAGAKDTAGKIADRITTAARDNKNFKVTAQTPYGSSADGIIYLTEKEGGVDTDDYKLEGKPNIKQADCKDGDWTGLVKLAEVDESAMGKSLSLQIGDTSESYNQLKVSISDCHVAAIGIGDIMINTQEAAQAAVSVIKDAINYVSDVRGTLGATQNRLDHTINNLSVMTENIQDAESTIRDTDIAEEMMAYTKNNILIQASQAMLAQANQVPQGVLQLLQ